MEITAGMVKELRERTSVGMMECKKALVETNGDIDAAIKLLREKGIAKAAKKADRETKEGRIYAYIHGNGKIGVLLHLSCETDFVARNEVFEDLCKNIAMHIAASDPKAIKEEDLSPELIANEREIYRQKAINDGKNEKFLDKIVEGQIEKFKKGVCLMSQEFVKNPEMTVQEVINEQISKMGENIQVVRFTRYSLGE